MGQAVFKCFFDRADFALLLASLIGVITVITRLGVEFFKKVPIILQQFVVSILNRDKTGNQFKQSLVLIALTVEFLFLVSDFGAHFIYRRSQAADFVILIDGQVRRIAAVGDKISFLNNLIDGTSDKPMEKYGNNTCND